MVTGQVIEVPVRDGRDAVEDKVLAGVVIGPLLAGPETVQAVLLDAPPVRYPLAVKLLVLVVASAAVSVRTGKGETGAFNLQPQ